MTSQLSLILLSILVGCYGLYIVFRLVRSLFNSNNKGPVYEEPKPKKRK